MRLNRTKGLPIPPFPFYTLSGPNYSEGLSGNTLAEHTMQQSGREQATSNVRTTSSEPEVTYSKSGWHVPSKHISAALTPAPAKRQYWYHAYIITP